MAVFESCRCLCKVYTSVLHLLVQLPNVSLPSLPPVLDFGRLLDCCSSSGTMHQDTALNWFLARPFGGKGLACKTDICRRESAWQNSQALSTPSKHDFHPWRSLRCRDVSMLSKWHRHRSCCQGAPTCFGMLWHDGPDMRAACSVPMPSITFQGALKPPSQPLS